MKKVEVKVLKGDEWQIDEELVLKERKVYILKDKELRVEIIQLHHDVLVARYKERQKTIELVPRNYQWSEVTKNIKKYVDECDLCQRIKNRTEAPVGNLIANEVPEKL